MTPLEGVRGWGGLNLEERDGLSILPMGGIEPMGGIAPMGGIEPIGGMEPMGGIDPTGGPMVGIGGLRTSPCLV